MCKAGGFSSLLRSRLLAGSTVASRSKWNNYLYMRLTDLLYYDGLDYKNVNKDRLVGTERTD